MRRAIQDSQESIAALAERYDLNPKTVHKWKQRQFINEYLIHDAQMGPKEVRSTVLTQEEEAIVVAFRQLSIPALTKICPAPLFPASRYQPPAGD